MTFSAVGAIFSSGTSTVSLTTHAVGNFMLVEVNNGSNATVTCTGLSSTNATWQPLTASFAGTTNAQTARVFIGIATAVSTATVTATWSGATPAGPNIAGREFSSTYGASAVVLDAQGHIDGAGTNTWASLHPAKAGGLYFGWCGDSGTATAGSTPGYVYGADSNGNGVAYNASCTAAAQAPVWGDSGMVFGVMVMVREAVPGAQPRAIQARIPWASQRESGASPGRFSVSTGPAASPANAVAQGFAARQVMASYGAAVINPAPRPVFAQANYAIRARAVPGAPRAGSVQAELPPATGNISGALNGAGMGANGAPVRNPAAGPLFRQAVQAVRGRLPLQPLLRGRCCSSPGAPVSNPSPGPAFRQKPAPVRFTLPPWRPRAGRIGSGSGAPVRNPAHGPPAYPLQGEVRAPLPSLQPRGRTSATAKSAAAVIPPPPAGPAFSPAVQAVRAHLLLPRRGTCRAIRFGPLPANPVQGPVFVQASRPARAVIQPPPRGRAYSSAGARVQSPPAPPVTPFQPLTQPAGVRVILLRTGHVQASGTSLVQNPVAGPVFRQAAAPARARIPQAFSKGRTGSSPGAPARNPGKGPAFRAASRPAQARIPLPPHGRIASSPGGPVANPAPPGTGPAFRPQNFAKAQAPLPRRGTCRTIRFGPLPVNPQAGPVFRQATAPAAARFPLPPRGRIASSPGGPVRNPVPGVTGPPFFPFRFPARIRPALPSRGRVTSSPGIPARNPHQGAAFPPLRGPVRAPVPQAFSKGRATGNPGIPPVVPAPLYPLHGPVQARIPLPPRGRTVSNPGGPLRNPAPVTGPPFYPKNTARAQLPLSRRGTCRTIRFGPLPVNPGTGPVFRPLDWPCRSRVPQNAPRGRTSSNPGGPVANIPVATLLFRLGSPYFQWDTATPGLTSEWNTGTPVFAWAAGVPETSA